MNTKYIRMFHAAPDEDFGGGENFALTHMQDAPVETPAPATTAPSFDPAAIGKAFAAELKGHFPVPAPAEPPRPQLTPEQIRQQLNVWEPDDAFMQQFGNLETQKAAVIAMRDGMLKQFDTIAQLRLHQMRAELDKQYEDKYGSAAKGWQEHQARERQSRFNTAFPQLANPSLAPVIAAVAQQISASGQQFADEASAFTALANGVEAVIKTTNPGFKLTGATAPSVKPGGTNPNAIRSAPVGGAASAAGGQPANEAKPKNFALAHLR